MLKEIYPNVYEYENFLTKEEHTALYDYVHTYADDKAWVEANLQIITGRAIEQHPDDLEKQRTQIENSIRNKTLGDSLKMGIPVDAHPLFESIGKKLEAYGLHHIFIPNLGIAIGVAKKQVTDEYMDQHSDDVYDPRIKTAMNYYINDDYEGGELYLSLQDLRIKPKANSLIICPGTADYLHGVLPVVGSIARYNMTMTSRESLEYYAALVPDWND